MWTHRIVLESLCHGDNAFVTLTYAEEKLPTTVKGIATLRPKDVQDWLKRLRKRIEPDQVRYFLCGEYGDESWRPHYHLALFGYPACRFGVSQYSRAGLKCCDNCDVISGTWGLGNIYLGSLSRESAGYIAGYVVKKMTGRLDVRLDGRHPEFARVSRRPGLGVDALHEVASEIMRYDLEERLHDVPSSLRHGNKCLPLGRFLRGRLRTLVGMKEGAPDATLEAMAEEVRELYEASRVAPTSEARELAFKNSLIDAGSAAVARMEGRQKIFKQRKML